MVISWLLIRIFDGVVDSRPSWQAYQSNGSTWTKMANTEQYFHLSTDGLHMSSLWKMLTTSFSCKSDRHRWKSYDTRVWSQSKFLLSICRKTIVQFILQRSLLKYLCSPSQSSDVNKRFYHKVIFGQFAQNDLRYGHNDHYHFNRSGFVQTLTI